VAGDLGLQNFDEGGGHVGVAIGDAGLGKFSGDAEAGEGAEGVGRRFMRTTREVVRSPMPAPQMRVRTWIEYGKWRIAWGV
jgi:hypothetical protein